MKKVKEVFSLTSVTLFLMLISIVLQLPIAELTQNYTLTVEVLDDDGNPLSNVSIVVSYCNSDGCFYDSKEASNYGKATFTITTKSPSIYVWNGNDLVLTKELTLTSVNRDDNDYKITLNVTRSLLSKLAIANPSDQSPTMFVLTLGVIGFGVIGIIISIFIHRKHNQKWGYKTP